MEKFLQNSFKALKAFKIHKNEDYTNNPITFGENIFNQQEKEPTFVFEPSFFDEQIPRLNDLDSNILAKSGNVFNINNRADIEKEIENIKKILDDSEKSNSILKKAFPKLYNRKLLKCTLKRIDTLRQTTNFINTKHIPIGENEKSNKELTEYLSEMNYLQAKLSKELYSK